MPTLNWIGKDKVVNHHVQVPFDPVFYAILENYVANGKDNYHEGIELMKYAKCYGIE